MMFMWIIIASMSENMTRGLSGEWGIIGYIFGILIFWAASTSPIFFGPKWGTIIATIFTIILILSWI